MSPISAEMNGNVSNQALNSSTNSNSNISNPKSILEDSNSGGSDGDGVNFSSSSCSGADSGGPMTASTPIADRSFEAIEQPTSSTENCNLGLSVPKYGTLIPNRVFVGGISCHTTETELLQLFSKYGAVRGTKIIMDRAGVSKGYGFVTFETEDEARRLFNAMNNREMAPIVHRDRRLNIAPAVKKQPVMRQNTTYGSQGSGGTSSTFSPPPFDSYYYGQSPQGDFFVPPVPLQDNFFQQSNGYPGAPVPSSGPFFSTMPNMGLGQAIPGPNGSIIFLPCPIPYQQALGGSEQWNASLAASTFSSNLNSFGGTNWRTMNQPGGLGNGAGSTFNGCNSHANGGIPSISSASLGSPPHQYMQDHGLGAGAGSSFPPGQDPFYYYSSALITSPH